MDSISVTRHGYLERVMPRFMMPCGLYGAMLAIWHYSPFYQRRFPLHQGDICDYWRFVAWCATDGHREYPLLLSLAEWQQDLAAATILPALKGDIWEGGYSMKMFLYAVTRYGGLFGAILKESDARHRVARYYWRGGRHHLNAPPIAPWQLIWLKETFGSITKMLEAITLPKKDKGKSMRSLIEEFGLSDVAAAFSDAALSKDSRDLDPVYLPVGIEKSELRIPSVWMRSISCWLAWLHHKPTEFQLAMVTSAIAQTRAEPSIEYPFGVNLFGYTKGELGIGEDIRLVAAALESNGIPFCIIDIKLGNHISQNDKSAEHWIHNKPLYGINIFCQTGIEMTRFVTKEGLDVFDGRYTIGLWPWELPEWPASCRHTYANVDEIWGISSYTAKAYSSFPRTVTPMTLPVTVSSSQVEERSELNLPENAYLYLFTFDIHSRTHRKNPFGLIKAFQKAFPIENSKEVGLVLKVNHSKSWCMDWARIRRIAKKDHRIILIERSMRRSEVIALMQACDCFVSLHRAEGFGRGIAEALLLDRQVITTGFSGNMDFCSEPRVGLVNARQRIIQKNEYFWSHGQTWMEPDIDHAATLMREIRVNPRDVNKTDIDLSPKTVGEQYAKRLRDIYEKFAK